MYSNKQYHRAEAAEAALRSIAGTDHER
jgi:hypothetical protein